MKRAPPGVLLIAIGYGAGLATGLSRFPAWWCVAAILGVGCLWIRPAWWGGVAALVAGCAVGCIARRDIGQSCAARLPVTDTRLRVRAIDPGEGTGRVQVLDRACVGSVFARWPGHPAAPSAGAVLDIQARWSPISRAFGRPDGTLLIDRAQVVQLDPTWPERLRTGVARNTHDAFGSRAPLALALLTGWRGELDPSVRDSFAGSGLMHLLTVSGWHVAWLAGWVLLILRCCGVPRHPAEIAAALVALGYAALLGWPAAATRASTLVLLVAVCRWRQRHVRTDALLAASALVVLAINPWSIAGVGFWLSIAGVGGVTIATRWSDGAVGRQWWIRGISASGGALIGTAPLASAVFGAVAPFGVAANLVAWPLMLLALPAVLAAVALHHVMPFVASGFGASGQVLLALLEQLARTAAAAPALTSNADGWQAAIPWIALAAAALWIVHGRATLIEAARRAGWSTVAGCWCTLALPSGAQSVQDHRLTLLFANVGQGDGALIRTPGGHWVEVDAGPADEHADAGERVIAPLLRRYGGRRIDVFVLSHAHRDHVGGGVGVLARVPIDLALEPGELFVDAPYEAWLAALAAHHVRWRAARRGTRWSIDGVSFEVLHPPDPWPRQGDDLNEDSIVLEVRYGGFRALLMGDGGFVAESALATSLPEVNLLKVGHHGSKTATSAAFLAAVRPQAAIVSVGRNHYGHPAAETMGRLAAAGVTAWRTDREGTVIVTTDGAGFTVKGARVSATFGITH